MAQDIASAPGEGLILNKNFKAARFLLVNSPGDIPVLTPDVMIERNTMNYLKKTMLVMGATALMSMTPAVSVANIVKDPGFELGDSSWSLKSSGTLNYTNTASHTGSFSVTSKCSDPACASAPFTSGSSSIVQTLHTVAGQTYDLSFWVGETGGPVSVTGGGSEFVLAWGPQDVNYYPIAHVFNPANNSLPSFVQYSYNNLLATTNSTNLIVSMRSSTGSSQIFGRIYFDDFSVIPTTNAVPVPATWALMLAGLGLMSRARRHLGL